MTKRKLRSREDIEFIFIDNHGIVIRNPDLQKQKDISAESDSQNNIEYLQVLSNGPSEYPLNPNPEQPSILEVMCTTNGSMNSSEKIEVMSIGSSMNLHFERHYSHGPRQSILQLLDTNDDTDKERIIELISIGDSTYINFVSHYSQCPSKHIQHCMSEEGQCDHIHVEMLSLWNSKVICNFESNYSQKPRITVLQLFNKRDECEKQDNSKKRQLDDAEDRAPIEPKKARLEESDTSSCPENDPQPSTSSQPPANRNVPDLDKLMSIEYLSQKFDEEEAVLSDETIRARIAAAPPELKEKANLFYKMTPNFRKEIVLRLATPIIRRTRAMGLLGL